MRLLLSATAEHGGDPLDVVLECAPGARVRDVARALAARLPREQVRVVPRGSGHLGLVGVVPDEDRDAPPLWWHGRPLDGDEPVETSPLRHGAVVGLGVDAGDPWAEPAGACELRVVSGEQAGRVRRLPVGRHAIGSDPASTVQVRSPEVPGTAVVLEVGLDGTVTVEPSAEATGLTVTAPVRRRPLDGPIVLRREEAATPARTRGTRRCARRLAEARSVLDGIAEVDPEADRPLVHVDRAPLTARRPWAPGQSLVVGDVVLELAEVDAPDASLSPSPTGATLDYNRPPRLLPPPRTTEFRLPTEPRAPERQRFPLAMMLLPVVMGAAMYWFTRSPYSLVIMALSPLMALSNYFSARGGRRSQHLEAVQTYATRVARIEQQAYDALAEESTARRRELPDPSTVLLFATGPRARLWERRRTDPDWMLVRVGTADVPSEVSLSDPAREEHERVLHWTAADVPVAVPLAQVGVTGVVGPGGARRRVAAWMLAQVATGHSPAEVSVVLLADGQDDETWGWVRWLPHLRRDTGPVAAVGNDEESTARRISELLDLVERRRAAAEGGAGRLGAGAALPPPVLVVIDGARRTRLLPGLVTLLREGPSVGVVFLCVDEQERQLPEECQAVVTVDPAGCTVAVAGRQPVDGVRADLVPDAWLERLGRSLAPVRDISSEDLSASLTPTSRLLDVLRLDPPDPDAIARLWAAGGRTTRAVIGESTDGPFTVDVRADGPHGLVAGTTGSGKSELLQTLIASLAIGNRPDEMTFVLVDYKGGAAFKDCSRLPHTVGMVTDLDAHLTTRALDSLAAELRRREHQLAGADAKDIEDYLAARGPADAPMPRLMIVIDEFAALVAELPDFVTGLVDIARRGRSLGVHLVLATQRPAGVVSAEIKSNTNLRIALRVTDRNDSQDVIESPDAAEIAPSLPGRAYARLGHSSLVAFQSSRVGGRPPAASGEGTSVRLAPLAWSLVGHAVVTPRVEATDDVDTPTDLAALVTAVRAAAERTGVSAPPPPWLPALPGHVTLADLEAQGGAALDAAPLTLPYGLVDLPAQQRRDVAAYDVGTAGHLAVVGAPRSGRSTVLRALAAGVASRTSPRDVHLYGLDFGNNALLPLVALPHTGAVVTRDQPDRIARLTRRLREEISRRQQLLAAQGFADVAEQRAGTDPAGRLPYLLVLLDRWEGFVQAFEDYDSGALLDLWTQILQEGAGAGVKVVLTGDRSVLVGRVSTLTEDRIMLPMADAGDYASVGMSPRQVPANLPDGRAFRSQDRQELQVGLLDDDPAGPAQVAALQRLARTAAERHDADRAADPVPAAQVPFRVDLLPTRIALAEAHRLGGVPLGATAVPAGVGGDTLRLFGLDAEEHGPGALVVGPRRSGRSTSLVTMGVSALERGWAVGLVTPRRSPLRDLAEQAGVVGSLSTESTRDEITALLAQLVPGSTPTLLLVDDLELVGTDGPLADAIVSHLGALRDRPGLVVAAGTADELSGAYRGPAATMKKSRSGLLLSPASPNDGELLGVRLPRSAVGPANAGRGVLVTAGAWQLVQVPVPD